MSAKKEALSSQASEKSKSKPATRIQTAEGLKRALMKKKQRSK